MEGDTALPSWGGLETMQGYTHTHPRYSQEQAGAPGEAWMSGLPALRLCPPQALPPPCPQTPRTSRCDSVQDLSTLPRDFRSGRGPFPALEPQGPPKETKAWPGNWEDRNTGCPPLSLPEIHTKWPGLGENPTFIICFNSSLLRWGTPVCSPSYLGG